MDKLTNKKTCVVVESVPKEIFCAFSEDRLVNLRSMFPSYFRRTWFECKFIHTFDHFPIL